MSTNRLARKVESSKICKFCLNPSENDGIILLFGTFSNELNIVKIIGQHFWFKPEPTDPICNAICTECWHKIETFHLFYTNVRVVQDKLLADANKTTITAQPQYPNFIDLELESIIKTEPDDHHECDNNDWPSDPIIGNDSDSDYFVKSPKRDTKAKRERRPVKPSTDYDFDEDQQIRQFFILNCDLCTDRPELPTFDSHLDYLIHFRKTHNIDRRSIICSICKTRSLTREQIRQHIRWHLNPNAYKCDICDRPCKSRYLLEVHKTQHIAEKPYECDICAQKFATKLLIYFHMYKHHSGKPSPAHRKPRKQPQKGKRKPTVASLPIKKSYQCVQCTESFDKKSTLKTHRERVHGHHEHICDICGKGYSDRGQLRKHMLSNHVPIEQRPLVRCQQCDQMFSSRYLLNKHVRYDHEGVCDESVCTQCGKTFKTGERLKIHIRVIHRNHRPAKCNYCGKGFKDTCILRDHIAGMHTGQPQYKCPCCDKTFRSAGSYYKHGKRMHSPVEWVEAVRIRQENGGSWRLT